MKKILTFLSITICLNTYAQIVWEKTYWGLLGTSAGYSVKQTFDGGYVASGIKSYGSGAFVYLVRVDVNGDTLWTKTFGHTSNVDMGLSVIQSADSGFVISGIDQNTVTGFSDVYIVKTNSIGDTLWTKIIGGVDNDAGYEVQQTLDGGYIVTGFTKIGSVTYTSLMKIDLSGNILWTKQFGGGYFDSEVGNSVKQTTDKGYIIAGQATHIGSLFGCLIKTDSIGDTLWTKILVGNYGMETAKSVQQTSDGGYIVAGFDYINANESNISLIKTDLNGNISWTKDYGKMHNFTCQGVSVELTNAGGYIIAANIIDSFAQGSACLLKINSSGDSLWCKTFNAVNAGYAIQTADYGYILTAENYGLYLVKTDSSGNWQNAINGKVFCDLNKDCILNNSDFNLHQSVVIINPGADTLFSDNSGNYSYLTSSGTYTISHVPKSNMGQNCPSISPSYTVNFSGYGNNFVANFGDTATTPCTDLLVSVGTWAMAPCFHNMYTIKFCNNGIIPSINSTLILTLDSEVILLNSSPSLTMIGPTSYSIEIDTLWPYQCGNVVVYDSVSCNAVVGSVKCVTVAIFSSQTDCDTSNNYSNDCITLTSAIDPNGKKVTIKNSSNGFLLSDSIDAQDELIYLINFQNTGTGYASTVIITDTLPGYLDLSSVTNLVSSHAYSYTTYGSNIIQWTFNNISLPDSGSDQINSHGFIKFKVKQTIGNTNGDIILNTANIVFDFNSPVITDTSKSIIYMHSTNYNESFSNKNQINIYPNPTSDQFVIEANTIAKLTLDLYDVSGRRVFSKSISEKSNINVTTLNEGIYSLVIKTAEGVINKKLVILR